MTAIHNRRAFLVLTGTAGVALLGGCGNNSSEETAPTTTSVAPAADPRAVPMLQTASSIEKVSVALYQQGLDSGVLKNEAAKTLQAQNQSHAGVLDGHTVRLGGQPAAQPHPALWAQVQERVADEGSILRAAFDVAQIAAATYQFDVTTTTDARLRVVFAAAAGNAARQAAYLGTLVNQSVPAGSFATTDKALK